MTDTPAPTDTSQLEGLALDYWVAIADGQRAEKFWHEGRGWVRLVGVGVPYSPSTLWAQAGPIIDRERIMVGPLAGAWCAQPGLDSPHEMDSQASDGPTPLVAAMRAFVKAKLGPIVGERRANP